MSMKNPSYYQRNQEKLRAYQRAYSQQKRAPGRRKVSKVERQLLEEQYVKKQALMELRSPSKFPRTPHDGGYACALIVRSRAVDPRRTASMAEQEEEAQQHFQELKDTLPKLSPRCWKEDFKGYVDTFIEEHLDLKRFFAAIPCENEEEEEIDRVYSHGLRRLVAGAAQEWELVEQPEHAAPCAKLDGALVWQGRGVNLKTFRRLYGW